MLNTYIVSDNIFSPIAFTTDENFLLLQKGISGIKLHDDLSMSPQPFYASLFEKNEFFLAENKNDIYTKFEQLLIVSIKNALKNTDIKLSDSKTILIISSTKGNISLLETEEFTPEIKKRMALQTSAHLVANYFQAKNQPIVVSNACISGILAILTGKRLIESGQYENAVVAGADVISKFILSGFQAFQAISSQPCRPFDAARNGITLGEGAATLVLSSNKKYTENIKVTGGSISNDANHISGPSRTGDGLEQAINNALNEANLTSNNIDFISTHGTATIFNDEMEANAINLINMQTVPVNSLKGFYGHTLGAAGLIESIASIQSLRKNLILPTAGFETIGVSKELNVFNVPKLKYVANCLKTASGFGGCNAAVVFSKV